MEHLNEEEKKKDGFFKRFCRSYIPNRRDSAGQVIVKIVMIICFLTLLISGGYLANHYISAQKQEAILDDAREIWQAAEDSVSSEITPAEPLTPEQKAAAEELAVENNDYKAWIKISNTKVNNPVYQTDNNKYYLDHNQNFKKSVYGALYFDYRNKITSDFISQNLVIYGHEMRNGSMFGTLKRLRQPNFFKSNPVVELSTFYEKRYYKIYAIFVLNAVKEDDNGYLYDICRNDFYSEKDFNNWTAEAYQRSILNTGIDVNYKDDILTLVTCCNDFNNARLIVMARRLRENETAAIDTSLVSKNQNARYPKKWYDKYGYNFPY